MYKQFLNSSNRVNPMTMNFNRPVRWLAASLIAVLSLVSIVPLLLTASLSAVAAQSDLNRFPPQMKFTQLGGVAAPAADQPTPRIDSNSQIAHAQLLEKARKGRIDIYFEGDSITRRWG